MLYPLLFKPVFQERIWGGRSLERLYNKPLPPDVPIGESWEISDRPEAQSVVVNGPLAGQTLGSIMRKQERELLGRAASLGGRFPLLVKILDARERLSLQVHPPSGKANVLNGEPKTEIWYITHAEPGAELYVGLRAGATRAEFEERIRSGDVAECFHRVPVSAGDAMFLPSGRVHAIGAGLVIFEIQQNSDTTYRVFDWNRVDAKGHARPLHVAESLECIDFSDFEPAVIRQREKRQLLVDDPLFKVEAWNLEREESVELSLETCVVLAVIDGAVEISHPNVPNSLRAGEFCLLPSVLGATKLKTLAGSRILLSRPGSSGQKN